MRMPRIHRIGRRNKTLLALSAVILVYTFATSIMQYNLALFTDALSTNYTLFGLIMGLPWFFSLLTDMPVGVFTEHFGKKRTIVLGLLGLSLSGFFLYSVSTIWQLFWILVAFGIFEGLLTVAGMASIISISSAGKEHRFIGGYTSASALGYTIGPLVAGLVVLWFGNRMPFLIFATFCLLGVVVAQVFLPSPQHHNLTFFRSLSLLFTRDHVYFSELKEFFSVGRIAVFVSFSMFFLGMWSEFIWAMEPIFVDTLGIPSHLGGVILFAFIFPFAALDYPVGMWLDKSQRRFAAMIGGLLMGGLGVLLFGMFSRFILLMFFASLASAGFALFYVAVNGIFDSFSDHHRRGYMTGVWQGAEDVGYVLGPLFGGVIADLWGLRGAFFAFGALFLFFSLWVVAERDIIKQYEKMKR